MFVVVANERTVSAAIDPIKLTVLAVRCAVDVLFLEVSLLSIRREMSAVERTIRVVRSSSMIGRNRSHRVGSCSHVLPRVRLWLVRPHVSLSR
jgi:hypothetical protein